MVAKRALDFSTPGRNVRQRTTTVVVRSRGAKPEMKVADFGISHTTTASNIDLVLAAGSSAPNRQGYKTKAWRIQGILVASVPYRVEILLPNVATATPSNVVSQLYNYAGDVCLGTYTCNPELSTNNITHIDHKLPIGVVTTYNGDASSDVTRNKIVVRITNAANATISGEFRLYFTDN